MTEDLKEGIIYVAFGTLANGKMVYGTPIPLNEHVNRLVQAVRCSAAAQVDDTLDWRTIMGGGKT